MTTNPVFSREMKISSRSIKLPLILAAFNIILAVFALASMAATLNQARSDAMIDYAAFLTIFKYVATIEFALVLFIMPALTAGNISGEREKRTLELMLTTKLTPGRIVIGKLLTSMYNVIVVLVSSLPVLALVFVYGGVTLGDFAVLMVSFVTVALVTAAIGTFASSFCARSSISTAIAYSFVLLLVGGTLGVCILAYNLGDSTGGWFYILLGNPAVTFYSAISSMTGNRTAVADMAAQLGTTVKMTSGLWFAAGTVEQILAGVLLTFFSIRNLYPRKKA